MAALYKYVVLTGNESVLMREALERRSWWAPAAAADVTAASTTGRGAWNLWWGGNGQKFDFSVFAGSE